MNYAPSLKVKAAAELELRRREREKPPHVLNLPTPYDLQREIIEHPAKRKVVCAGRRVGKTILAAIMAVNGMMDSKRVLLSSTSQDQADVFWEYIIDWLSPLIGHDLYKNEVKRIVKYKGGQIHVKTGRHPDALRGGQCDLLVLDECAFLDEDAWRKVGAPMLADTEGTAVFISTPNRRNWFFQLYTEAQSQDESEWKTWNFSSLENPHLPQKALDRLIADMTQEDYQQEILAQFLEGQGAVFRRIDENATLQPLENTGFPLRCCEPSINRHYVMGVDWAMQKDFTVLTVLDRDSCEMVALDRFNGVDWALQRGRLKALYETWKPDIILAESNSIGSPNIEALQRDDLPVYPFETTGTSKPLLIESLVLAFERNELKVLNNPILKGELMAYERKVSATGRSQYSAPDGMHDDCVISLALALWAITSSGEFYMETAPEELRHLFSRR